MAYHLAKDFLWRKMKAGMGSLNRTF